MLEKAHLFLSRQAVGCGVRLTRSLEERAPSASNTLRHRPRCICSMPACVERAQPDASALWTAAAANALECNGYDAVLTTAILTTPPNGKGSKPTHWLARQERSSPCLTEAPRQHRLPRANSELAAHSSMPHDTCKRACAEELLPRPKEGEGAAADCAAGQCRTICVSKLLPPSMQRDAWCVL